MFCLKRLQPLGFQNSTNQSFLVCSRISLPLNNVSCNIYMVFTYWYWWHCKLSLRQLTVPSVRTKLSNWQSFASSAYIWSIMSLIKKIQRLFCECLIQNLMIFPCFSVFRVLNLTHIKHFSWNSIIFPWSLSRSELQKFSRVAGTLHLDKNGTSAGKRHEYFVYLFGQIVDISSSSKSLSCKLKRVVPQ